MIVNQEQLDILQAELDDLSEENEGMAATIQTLRTDANRTCFWASPYEDHDDDDAWEGECGAVWQFFEGGPVENQQKFCPNCGGKVRTKGEDNDG